MNTLKFKPDLIEKVIRKFQDTVGKNLKIEKQVGVHKTGQRTDLILLLSNGKKQKFYLEVKNRLTEHTLGATIQQLNQLNQKGMIIADYINPKIADRLRGMNVAFLDTSGNAYINEPNLFIFIKGNKPAETFQKTPFTKIFHPAGLKVLFALLCNPELIQANYREVAKAADVALGTVMIIYNDLKQNGLLIDLKEKGRRLTDKKKILDQWVEAYPERLKPKMFLGRYKAPSPDWWKDVTLNHIQGYWGGEIAAAKLTHYLKPEIATIYFKEKTAPFLLKNKLKLDPKGDVEIFNVFWKTEWNWKWKDLTPPLLIYTDLLATGDARNLETARIIYDQELARFIE